MRVVSKTSPILPPDIQSHKGRTPLVMLTAYTTPMAKHVDQHCDIALVGDSLGMVLHGLPSTNAVTIEMMILHGQAVVRGLSRALAVIDMPFGTYEESPAQAYRNAVRILAQTGAAAVKLEGGHHMAETIRFLTDRGIPVMAHIGLTPQTATALGGYKVVGRGAAGEKLLSDAQKVTEAGAFAVVLEMVPSDIAAEITAQISIPTLGIGAGVSCDGQVLVSEDMLGLFNDFKPKFVKRYDDLGTRASEAIAQYAAEVRNRTFPAPEHSFSNKSNVITS